MEELSALLQQAVNALQIACDEDTSDAVQARNVYIAKNYAEQALIILKTLMGPKFQNYYSSALLEEP